MEKNYYFLNQKLDKVFTVGDILNNPRIHLDMVTNIFIGDMQRFIRECKELDLEVSDYIFNPNHNYIYYNGKQWKSEKLNPTGYIYRTIYNTINKKYGKKNYLQWIFWNLKDFSGAVHGDRNFIPNYLRKNFFEDNVQGMMKDIRNIDLYPYNIIFGTNKVIIVNEFTGKTSIAKCNEIDDFTPVEGLAIAWAKYCGRKIYNKRIYVSIENLDQGETFYHLGKEYVYLEYNKESFLHIVYRKNSKVLAHFCSDTLVEV